MLKLLLLQACWTLKIGQAYMWCSRDIYALVGLQATEAAITACRICFCAVEESQNVRELRPMLRGSDLVKTMRCTENGVRTMQSMMWQSSRLERSLSTATKRRRPSLLSHLPPRLRLQLLKKLLPPQRSSPKLKRQLPCCCCCQAGTLKAHYHCCTSCWAG